MPKEHKIHSYRGQNCVSAYTWYDVTIGDVEVVVGPEDVAWNYGGELAPVLLLVPTVHHVQHTFGIAVPKVAVMWWPVVDLLIFRSLLLGSNHFNYYLEWS